MLRPSGKAAARLTAVFTAMILLASCGGQTPSPSATGAPSSASSVTPTQHPPVTMTVAYGTDPKMFNGIVQNFSYTSQIMIQMFDRLIEYDKDYNVVGDLAQSWETSSDGKTWTFHLRPNVKWHDGVPFTSADVAYHYQMLKQYDASPAGVAVQSLENVETPDDLTAIFHFAQPTHIDAFLEVYADTFILPKHLYEGKDLKTNPANLKPIGTGPFKFVSYTPGVSITLEANDDYFGGRPKIDKLVYQIIPEAPAALLALRSGEVDVIEMTLGIPPSEVPNLQSDSKLDVDAFPYYTTAWLAFSSRPEGIKAHPWLADPRVREAIMLAIDRNFILQRVLNGVTTLTNTAISSTITWAYDTSVQVPGYDTTQAEQLLDQAGWPRKSNGIRFSMDIAVPIYGGMDKAAEAMVEMLKQVGIDVKLKETEVSSFIQSYMQTAPSAMGDTAATVISGGTGPDPIVIDNWYDGNRTPADTPPGFNYYDFNDPDVNQLLQQAQTVFTHEAAAPIFKQIQQDVAKTMLIYPLFNRYQIEAWSKKFTGFRETHRPLAWFASYAKITPVE